MKALCRIIVVATQAAAFSLAKVPATNFAPSLWPLITGRRAGAIAIHSMKAAPILSKTILALFPASIGGILLRGGGAAADTVVTQNFYGDALGFFGAIRIPATFFAGSSLAAIFTLKSAFSSLSSNNEEGKITTLERRVIKFYHLTSLLAFLLSLNTVVAATSAHTSILHGRFNQMAESAYVLMSREFEYEFVSVRWSFLTSIFCFLGMVTSRVLIEFGLLRKECEETKKDNTLPSIEFGSLKKHDETRDETRKDMAMLVVCSVGALAAHLLSDVNQKLRCWPSLIGMTVHLAQLVMKRAFVEKRPLQIVSVLCTLTSVFYVGKLAVRDIKEGT
mmetsp:Transcript_2538/g.5413  ORF Transcript_2538/g.5413 Transcript_2538/m.5413 type:complete len:334 (-) Transcript_2538:191-1192(-)